MVRAARLETLAPAGTTADRATGLRRTRRVRAWTGGGRSERGVHALLADSPTTNNQLRTGADKGNPTV